jgi:hypothetical protein
MVTVRNAESAEARRAKAGRIEALGYDTLRRAAGARFAACHVNADAEIRVTDDRDATLSEIAAKERSRPRTRPAARTTSSARSTRSAGGWSSAGSAAGSTFTWRPRRT